MKRFAPLLLAALIACGGSEPTNPSFTAIYGTWILQSVNGSPPPSRASTGTEMLGSSFVANDGRFTLTSVVRASGSGTNSETNVESGGVFCGHVGCRPLLLIVYESGANADALVDGTSLTLTRGDDVFVYRRP